MTQADQEASSVQVRFRKAVTSYVKAPLAERLDILVRIGALTDGERLKALEKAKSKRRDRVVKSHSKKTRTKSAKNGTKLKLPMSDVYVNGKPKRSGVTILDPRYSKSR